MILMTKDSIQDSLASLSVEMSFEKSPGALLLGRGIFIFENNRTETTLTTLGAQLISACCGTVPVILILI